MKGRNAALTGRIISIAAITMQLHEIRKQCPDIVCSLWTLGMACQINGIPGIQLQHCFLS